MHETSTAASRVSFSQEAKTEYKNARTDFLTKMRQVAKNHKKRIELNLKYAETCAKIFNNPVTPLLTTILTDDLIAFKEFLNGKP